MPIIVHGQDSLNLGLLDIVLVDMADTFHVLVGFEEELVGVVAYLVPHLALVDQCLLLNAGHGGAVV